MWVGAVALLALARSAWGVGSLGASPSDALLLHGVFALHVVVFSAAGLALLFVGNADRRAVALGLFFLVSGSAFANALLQGATGSLSAALGALRHLRMDALGPFFFWLFISRFPHAVGRSPGGRLARWFTAGTLVLGAALLLGNLLIASLPTSEAAARLAPWIDGRRAGSLYWPLLFLSLLPALPFAVWRARRTSPDERRRVQILLAGLGFGLAPDIVVTLVAALHPEFARFAFTPLGRVVVGALVYPALLSIPIVTAYAVLVHRALDVRLIIRKAVQYAFARTTVVATVALPFGAAFLILYARRDESVAELLTGTGGVMLASAVAVGSVAVWLRPAALQLVDRRFFREQYDARVVLTGLVERIRHLRSHQELAEALAHEVDRALHVLSVELLLHDPATGFLLPLRGTTRSLPDDTSLSRLLGTARDPLDVDWESSRGWLSSLPEAEQQWLADSGAHLLVPIPRVDGSALGVLLLGEKRSELPFSGEDRMLLAVIAGSVALRVESWRSSHPASWPLDPGAAQEADLPARECAGCGVVVETESEHCHHCFGETRVAAVPPLLAGKFRMVRRLGQGGMGVVYLAHDVSLERRVAVKTLPRMSAAEAAQLRREARTMAAVIHPTLATIYGAESWRGVPMLVVEHLPGGTLADRLSAGPLQLDEALALGATLCSALEWLHQAGVLHRDIKPSNIGYTAQGSPKLLDFGLSHVLEAVHRGDPALQPAAGGGGADAPAGGAVAEQAAGTLLYMSPEALQGEPPDPTWDLWSLAVVLYEAIAGRSPFDGSPALWTMVRIAEADFPDIRGLAPHAPASVQAFFRDALASDPARRPGSARQLGARLAALRGSVGREAA